MHTLFLPVMGLWLMQEGHAECFLIPRSVHEHHGVYLSPPVQLWVGSIRSCVFLLFVSAPGLLHVLSSSLEVIREGHMHFFVCFLSLLHL